MNSKERKEIQKRYRQEKEDFKYGRMFEEKEKSEDEKRFEFLVKKND